MKKYCDYAEKNTEYLPVSENEKLFDNLLAETAIEISLKRHAGYITQEYDSIMGIIPGMPVGRDLRKVKNIIGVGGFLVHGNPKKAKGIIRKALERPGFSLLPEKPDIIIDENYLLYAAGAISQIDNEYAFNLLKNYF